MLDLFVQKLTIPHTQWVFVRGTLGMILLAGCGAPASTASPASRMLALDELRLGVALCRVGARCGQIGASEEQTCEHDALGGPTHHDADVGFIPYHQLEVGVASGRLAFDSSRADACLDGVEAAPCRRLTDALLDCLGAFQGTVEAGGACSTALDCAATLECDNQTHQCVSLPRDGEPCPAGACQAGLICLSQRCTARFSEGAACDTDGQCVGGLFCVFMTCRAEAVAGGPCVGDAHCLPGLYCHDSMCVPQLGATGACLDSLVCQDGLLCLGRTFDPITHGVATAGQCAPYSDLGQPCDANHLDSGCPDDMTCDPATSTCTKP